VIEVSKFFQAWHSWAVVNFECVLHYKNKLDTYTEPSSENADLLIEEGWFFSVMYLVVLLLFL